MHMCVHTCTLTLAAVALLGDAPELEGKRGEPVSWGDWCPNPLSPLGLILILILPVTAAGPQLPDRGQLPPPRPRAQASGGRQGRPRGALDSRGRCSSGRASAS